MVDSFVFRRGQVKRFHSHIYAAGPRTRSGQDPGPDFLYTSTSFLKGHHVRGANNAFLKNTNIFHVIINIFIFHQIHIIF